MNPAIHCEPELPVFELSPATPAARADVVLVRARADLDLVAEAAARDELGRICDGLGPERWVLLYLGSQIFVDGRGLDVLLSTAARATMAGRVLLIVDPPRPLVRMVDGLGLGGELLLVDSAWDALTVLVGSPVTPQPTSSASRSRPVDGIARFGLRHAG